MKIRVIALCCALALVAAACGSRQSDADLQQGAGDGGGGGGQQTVDGGGNGGGGVTEGDDGPMIGTLPVPCGEGDGENADVDAPGVTADTMRIAVISDKAGVVRVPTISIEESVQAFVDFCNGFGGINGRELELVKIDSELFNHLEATREACDAGVFAIVGSGSVTDNSGAQAMVDCGLIEVPAYTVTPDKSLSDGLVAPLPNPPGMINDGPAKYVVDQHPDAVTNAAILHGGIEAIDIQTERVLAAYEAAGFEFVYDKRTGVMQEGYTAEVREMIDAGVEYVTMISATSEVSKLLRDMATQGFEPEVIDLGQQYYDPDLLLEPGSEGAIVQTNTVPFEEAGDSPALQAYLEAYDAVDGSKPEPATLGVQAFSAGLLFATAVEALGDDISRDAVLAELQTITDWDGGGLHFPSNPGDNGVSTCFMYLQVVDGAFERLHPGEPTGFDCDDGYAFDLGSNFGAGATAGG